MHPYVRPDAEEAEFMTSRRATSSRQSRLNHGTLNLFSPAYYAPEPTASAAGTPVKAKQQQQNGHHRYLNYESKETCEFPSSGIRRVPLPAHADSPQGIKHLGHVPAAKQNIQVVNITAAYKDPTRMEPLRPSVRVLPGRQDSAGVKASLAYPGDLYDRQLRSEVVNTPVGKCRPTASKRTMDYTHQEHFCQAVRDHVQQRARGATEFYVQLCRGTIGGVTASTPRPCVRHWVLEQEPAMHTLSLARCRDQLVALTELPVTLLELADLLWDMKAYKENAIPDAGLSRNEEQRQLDDLGSLAVPYKDFSATFGANSSNARLAVKKI